MARTTRRRRALYNYDWVLSDYGYTDGSFSLIKRVGIQSFEGKKRLAHYHSDAGFGDYAHATPPHFYRRELNHRASQKEEQHLHRWRRLGDDRYEVPQPKRVRDASYYW